MYVGVCFFFKLAKKGIYRIDIQVRSQQADRLTTLRTGCSKNIQIFVLRLPPGIWPCAPDRPLASQCSLLAEASFILKPDFNGYSRIISTELPDLINDFFLKDLRASGSPLGCSGREDT